jgi:predicted DNA repair protein MutK
MMRSLSVIGTIAMFMVGGGILTHGLPFAHHAIEAAAQAVEGIAVVGPVLGAITPAVLNALFGVVAGAVVLVVVKLAQRVLSLFKKKN